MRTIRMLKRTQIATVVMLLAMGQVFAAGSDAITTPPSVTANQPFLLDSGVWDFTVNTYGNWPTTNQKQCPANFVPFLQITPYKTVVTQDVQMSNFGQVYACIFPYSDPSYAGNHVYINGNGYKANVIFSTIASSGKGNLGTKWSIYCYPAGSALPADDNSCNNLPATQAVYSQTYPMQSLYTVNNYNTYGYNVAQLYIDAGHNNWEIPFLGNGSNGAYNVDIVVPYSGTYQLTLKVNLIDTGDTTTCMAFYYTNKNTGDRNPLVSTGSEVRIRVPGSSWPNLGNTATTLQYTGVHFNAGERFSIQGINWAGNCGCADMSHCPVLLTSDGFLTITRTGP